MEGAAEDELAGLTPAQRKLFELRMKVNAGRKANKQVRALGRRLAWIGWRRGL